MFPWRIRVGGNRRDERAHARPQQTPSSQNRMNPADAFEHRHPLSGGHGLASLLHAKKRVKNAGGVRKQSVLRNQNVTSFEADFEARGARNSNAPARSKKPDPAPPPPL